MQLSGLMRSLY